MYFVYYLTTFKASFWLFNSCCNCYESEFTRIRPYALHFDPGPLLLSFTLEFNSDKYAPFMVTIFLQNINYAK